VHDNGKDKECLTFEHAGYYDRLPGETVNEKPIADSAPFKSKQITKLNWWRFLDESENTDGTGVGAPNTILLL